MNDVAAISDLLRDLPINRGSHIQYIQVCYHCPGSPLYFICMSLPRFRDILYAAYQSPTCREPLTCVAEIVIEVESPSIPQTIPSHMLYLQSCYVFFDFGAT